MSLLECWNRMYGGGDLRVDPPADARHAAADEALIDAIRATEAAVRSEMPFDPPPLDEPVASWAAQQVYRACQFLVFREIEPKAVRAELATPCPRPPSAEVCYSADLALRVLPDLLTLARAASPDDPLVHCLVELSRQWPLSSVGEPMSGADVSSFIEHPSLRQLYADRILQKGDASRLDDPRVVAAVTASLGAHAELAPAALAAALRAKHE